MQMPMHWLKHWQMQRGTGKQRHLLTLKLMDFEMQKLKHFQKKKGLLMPIQTRKMKLI